MGAAPAALCLCLPDGRRMNCPASHVRSGWSRMHQSGCSRNSCPALQCSQAYIVEGQLEGKPVLSPLPAPDGRAVDVEQHKGCMVGDDAASLCVQLLELLSAVPASQERLKRRSPRGGRCMPGQRAAPLVAPGHWTLLRISSCALHEGVPDMCRSLQKVKLQA